MRILALAFAVMLAAAPAYAGGHGNGHGHHGKGSHAGGHGRHAKADRVRVQAGPYWGAEHRAERGATADPGGPAPVDRDLFTNVDPQGRITGTVNSQATGQPVATVTGRVNRKGAVKARASDRTLYVGRYTVTPSPTSETGFTVSMHGDILGRHRVDIGDWAADLP